MKFTLVCLLGLLVSASAGSVSPVTRVVELLKGLSKQIEKDGDTEENLYETFVCWGKSVVEQKTAANAAANSKIDELEAYLADLDAGRIELSTERIDLERDIAELRGDMEMADAMRTKENQDFTVAEKEMKQGVTALKSAMDVLNQATKDHKKGTLLAVRQTLNGGMEALAEQQANLKNAVQFGERFLDKADSLFLRRLLLGDVPKVDWKKLNRKATFKMSYKARSGKIQDILTKMHQTFSINLKDAQASEKKAKDSYDKLSASKQGQLDTAQSALTKMAGENGARGQSKQDCKDEVKSLKTQVTNDEKFVKETTQALADKKAEWKVRSALRAGELAAISKAVSILFNDDARDLMKRSAASQGFFFLQTGMTAANGAAAALREAARRSGDARLLTLAAIVAAPKSVKTKFGPVLDAIKKMVAILKSDEEKDLNIKQTCEEDRMANSKKAIDAGREIDDNTDKITRLSEEISKLAKEIADLKAEHDKVKEELKKASDIRKNENAAWKVTDKDDTDAAATVASAKKVIEDFYKDNKVVFTQKAAQPATSAGEAPPPPPATWGSEGQLKEGESTGIVSMLEMVHEDILKDKATAKSEEDQSQSEFNKFKAASNKQMRELNSDKNARSATKGKKETERTNTEKARGIKKGELDSTMKLMKSINPNCEYYEVNYPLRRDNRQLELDGLEKATAILNGGTFDKGPDANREIKPGDSFLQKRA